MKKMKSAIVAFTGEVWKTSLTLDWQKYFPDREKCDLPQPRYGDGKTGNVLLGER